MSSFSLPVGLGTGLLINAYMPGKPLLSAGAGAAASYAAGSMKTPLPMSTTYAILGAGVGSLLGASMGGGKPWLGAAIGGAAGYYYGNTESS